MDTDREGTQRQYHAVALVCDTRLHSIAEQTFTRKVDAIAWAEHLLHAAPCCMVRVSRLAQVIALDSDWNEVVRWTTDAQVYERRRTVLPGEWQAWETAGRPIPAAA